MSKVIFIGSDRSIFEENSATRRRIVEYGGLFDELRVVIFSKRSMTPKSASTQLLISKNTSVYGTNSWSRWFYIFDAIKIAKKVVGGQSRGVEGGWVISAQDPFESGLVAYFVAKKTGAKLHIQIHTDFLSSFFKVGSWLNLVRLLISRFVLKRADGVRVVSPRIKKSLLSNRSYLLRVDPIVLPIYVEPKKSAIPFDFKRNHPEWHFVILMVGRLEKEKNYPLALRVFKRVSEEHKGVGLVIAGDGSEDPALREFTRTAGLGRDVLFLGKVDDLGPYYKGVDLFLHTADYEGFGLSLLEAANEGLPIVTTDVGSVGWLLRDKENCLVCSPRDEEGLVHSVMSMISDGSLRAKIRSKLEGGFGDFLPRSKDEYLRSYKKSIESVFLNGI